MNLKTAFAALLLLCSTGCVLVGGYSSDGGFWIWPGSIVLLLIGVALVLFMLFRRRG